MKLNTRFFISFKIYFIAFSMISEYIQKIKPHDKFAYGVVLVVSVWFFSQIFVADISFLIALIIGFTFIYYKDDEIAVSASNMNNDLEFKLNNLLKIESKPPPRYFYIDPDMITFFDSIADFRVYNRDSFIRAIRTTDNLLQLRRELEYDFLKVQEQEIDSWQNFELHGPNGPAKTIVSNIKNHAATFQAAELFGNKGLNYIHSFIINLPPNKFYKNKHKEAMDRYHLLVKRNLDVILSHCKRFSKDLLLGQDYGKPRAHNKLQGKQGFSANSFDYF